MSFRNKKNFLLFLFAPLLLLALAFAYAFAGGNNSLAAAGDVRRNVGALRGSRVQGGGSSANLGSNPEAVVQPEDAQEEKEPGYSNVAVQSQNNSSDEVQAESNRDSNILAIAAAMHPNGGDTDDAKRLRRALLFLGLAERFHKLGVFAEKYKKIDENGRLVDNFRPGTENDQGTDSNSPNLQAIRFKTAFPLAVPELDDYYALWRVLRTRGHDEVTPTEDPSDHNIFQSVADNTSTPFPESNLVENLALTSSSEEVTAILNAKQVDNNQENLISNLAILVLAKIITGRAENPHASNGPVAQEEGRIATVNGLYAIIDALTNPATAQNPVSKDTSGSIYMNPSANVAEQAALTGKLRQQIALLLLAHELSSDSNPLTLPTNQSKSANFDFLGFKSRGANNVPAKSSGIEGLIGSLFTKRKTNDEGDYYNSVTIDRTKTAPSEYIPEIGDIKPQYDGHDSNAVDEHEGQLRFYNSAAAFYNLVVLRAAHAISADEVGLSSSSDYDDHEPDLITQRKKINSSWLTEIAEQASDKLVDLLRTDDDGNDWGDSDQRRFFHDLMVASALHEIFNDLESEEDENERLKAKWQKEGENEKEILTSDLRSYVKENLFRGEDLAGGDADDDNERQSQSRLFEWDITKEQHRIYNLTVNFFRENATPLEDSFKGEDPGLNAVQLFYLMILWRDRAKVASNSTTSDVKGFTAQMATLETGDDAIASRQAVHSAEVDLLVFFLLNLAGDRNDLDIDRDNNGVPDDDVNIMKLYEDFRENADANNVSLADAIIAIGMLSEGVPPASRYGEEFAVEESPWRRSGKFKDTSYGNGDYITKNQAGGNAPDHSDKANRIRNRAVILHDFYALNALSAAKKQNLKKSVTRAIASILINDESGSIALALLLFGAIGLFNEEQKNALSRTAPDLKARYDALLPVAPDPENPTPFETLLNKDSNNKVPLVEIATAALRVHENFGAVFRGRLLGRKSTSSNFGLSAEEVRALASLFVEIIRVPRDADGNPQASILGLLKELQTLVTTTNENNPLQVPENSPAAVEAISFFFALDAASEITASRGREALNPDFENEFAAPVVSGSDKTNGSFKYTPANTGTGTPAKLKLQEFFSEVGANHSMPAKVLAFKNRFLDLFSALSSQKTKADYPFTDRFAFLDEMFPDVADEKSAKLRLALWHLAAGYQLWDTGILCQDQSDQAVSNGEGYEDRFMTQKALLLPVLQNYYRFWNLINQYDGDSNSLVQREASDDTRTYNLLSQLARAPDKAAARAILEANEIPNDALTVLSIIVEGAEEDVINVQRSGAAGERTIVADGLFRVFADLNGDEAGKSLHETPNAEASERKIVSDETRDSLSLALFAHEVLVDEVGEAPEEEEADDVNSNDFRSWSYDSEDSAYTEEENVIEAMKDVFDMDENPDSSSLENYLPITKEKVDFWLGWSAEELSSEGNALQNSLADATNDFVILVNLRLLPEQRAHKTGTGGGRNGDGGGRNGDGGGQNDGPTWGEKILDAASLLGINTVVVGLRAFNAVRAALTVGSFQGRPEKRRFAADLLFASALYKIFKAGENIEFDATNGSGNNAERIIPANLATYLKDLFKLKGYSSLFKWGTVIKIVELLLSNEETALLDFLRAEGNQDFLDTEEAYLLLKIFQNRNVTIEDPSPNPNGTISKGAGQANVNVSAFTAQMALLRTLQNEKHIPVEIQLALFVLENTARERFDIDTANSGTGPSGDAVNLMKDRYFEGENTNADKFAGTVTALGLLLEWEYPENANSNKTFNIDNTAWEKSGNDFQVLDYTQEEIGAGDTMGILKRRAGALHDFYATNALDSSAKDFLREDTVGIIAGILMNSRSKDSLLSMMLFASIGLMTGDEKIKLGEQLSEVKTQYDTWTPAVDPADNTVLKAIKDLLTIPEGDDQQSKLSKIALGVLGSDNAEALKNELNSNSAPNPLRIDSYEIQALLTIFMRTTQTKSRTDNDNLSYKGFNYHFKTLSEKTRSFGNNNPLSTTLPAVEAIAEFFQLPQSKIAAAADALNEEFENEFEVPNDENKAGSFIYQEATDAEPHKIALRKLYRDNNALTVDKAQARVKHFRDLFTALALEDNDGTKFPFAIDFLDYLFPKVVDADAMQADASAAVNNIKIRLAFWLLSFGRAFKDLGVFTQDSVGNTPNADINFKTEKPLNLAALENYYRFWNLLDAIDDTTDDPSANKITGSSADDSLLMDLATETDRVEAEKLIEDLSPFMKLILNKIIEDAGEATVDVSVAAAVDKSGTDASKFTTEGLFKVFADLAGTEEGRTLNSAAGALGVGQAGKVLSDATREKLALIALYAAADPAWENFEEIGADKKDFGFQDWEMSEDDVQEKAGGEVQALVGSLLEDDTDPTKGSLSEYLPSIAAQAFWPPDPDEVNQEISNVIDNPGKFYNLVVLRAAEENAETDANAINPGTLDAIYEQAIDKIAAKIGTATGTWTADKKREFAHALLLASALKRIYDDNEENLNERTTGADAKRIVNRGTADYLRNLFVANFDGSTLFNWPANGSNQFDPSPTANHKTYKIAEGLIATDQGNSLKTALKAQGTSFTEAEIFLLFTIFTNLNNNDANAPTKVKKFQEQINKLSAENTGYTSAAAMVFPDEIEHLIFVLHELARNRSDIDSNDDGTANADTNLMKDRYSPNTQPDNDGLKNAIDALKLILPLKYPKTSSDATNHFVAADTSWNVTAGAVSMRHFGLGNGDTTANKLRKRAAYLHDFYRSHAISGDEKKALKDKATEIIIGVLYSDASKGSVLSMMLFASIALMTVAEKEKLGEQLPEVNALYDAWTPDVDLRENTVAKAIKVFLTTIVEDNRKNKSKLSKFAEKLTQAQSPLNVLKLEGGSYALDSYGIRAFLTIFVRTMETKVSQPAHKGLNYYFKTLSDKVKNFDGENNPLSAAPQTPLAEAIVNFFQVSANQNSALAKNEIMENLNETDFQTPFISPADHEGSNKRAGSFTYKPSTQKLALQEFYSANSSRRASLVEHFRDLFIVLADTGNSAATRALNFLNDLFPERADIDGGSTQERANKLRLALWLLSFGRDFKDLGVFTQASPDANRNAADINFKTTNPLKLAALENYYRFWNLLDAIDDTTAVPSANKITGATSAASLLMQIVTAADRAAAKALIAAAGLTPIQKAILNLICDQATEAVVNVAVTDVADKSGTDASKFTANGLFEVFVNLAGTGDGETLNSVAGALGGANPGRHLLDETREKLALIAIARYKAKVADAEWDFEALEDQKKNFGFQNWGLSDDNNIQKKNDGEVQALVGSLMEDDTIPTKGSISGYLPNFNSGASFWDDAIESLGELIEYPGRFYNRVVLRAAEVNAASDSGEEIINSETLDAIYEQAIDKIAEKMTTTTGSWTDDKKKKFAHALLLASALKRIYDVETGGADTKLNKMSKSSPGDEDKTKIVSDDVATYLRNLFALDGSTLFNWPANGSNQFDPSPNTAHKTYIIAQGLASASEDDQLSTLKSKLKNTNSDQGALTKAEIFLLFTIFTNLNNNDAGAPTKVKKFQEQIDKLSDQNDGRDDSAKMGFPEEINQLIFVLHELARSRSDIDLNGDGAISGAAETNNVNFMKSRYFDNTRVNANDLKTAIDKLKLILPLKYPKISTDTNSFDHEETSWKIRNDKVSMRHFGYPSVEASQTAAELRKKAAHLHDYYRANSLTNVEEEALKDQSALILAAILLNSNSKGSMLALLLFASIALFSATQKAKLGTASPELHTLFNGYANAANPTAKSIIESLKYLLTSVQGQNEKMVVPLVEIAKKALETGTNVAALKTKMQEQGEQGVVVTGNFGLGKPSALRGYHALTLLFVRTMRRFSLEGAQKESIIKELEDLNAEATTSDGTLLDELSNEEALGSETLGGAVHRLFTYEAAKTNPDTPAWGKEFNMLKDALNEKEDDDDAETTGKFTNNFECELENFHVPVVGAEENQCTQYADGSFKLSPGIGDDRKLRLRDFRPDDWTLPAQQGQPAQPTVDVYQGRFLDLFRAFDSDDSSLIDTTERKAMAERIATEKRFRLAIAILGAAMALDRKGAFQSASADNQNTPAIASLADLYAVLNVFKGQAPVAESLVGAVYTKDVNGNAVTYDTKLNYFAAQTTEQPIIAELLQADQKQGSEDFNIKRADFELLQKLYFEKNHTVEDSIASKKGIYKLLEELDEKDKSLEDKVRDALALVLLMENVEEDATTKNALLNQLEKYGLKGATPNEWDGLLTILKTIVNFHPDEIDTPEAATIKSSISFFADHDQDISDQDAVTKKYQIFYNYYALKASGAIPETQAKDADTSAMINDKWLNKIRSKTIDWFAVIFLKDDDAHNLDKNNFLYELSLLNVVQRLDTLSKIEVQDTGADDPEIHEPIPHKLAKIYNNLEDKDDIDFYDWNNTRSSDKVKEVRDRAYGSTVNLREDNIKNYLKPDAVWSASNLFAFLFLWNKRKAATDSWNLKEAGQELSGADKFDSTFNTTSRIYKLLQLFFTLDTGTDVPEAVKTAYNAFGFLRVIADDKYYYAAAAGADPAQTKIDIAFKNGSSKAAWRKSKTAAVAPQIEQIIDAYSTGSLASTAAEIETRAATFHDIVLAQNLKEENSDKPKLNTFRDSITDEITLEYRKDKKALLALGLLGALRYLHSRTTENSQNYAPKTDTDRLNNEAEYIASSKIEALDFVVSTPSTTDDIWRLPVAARGVPVSEAEILTEAKSSPAINTAHKGLADNASTLKNYLKEKVADNQLYKLVDDRIFEINDFLLNTQDRENNDNEDNYIGLLRGANSSRNVMVEQASDDFAEGVATPKKQTKNGLTRRLFLLVLALLNRPNSWQFESVIEMIGLYNADISSFEKNGTTGKPEVSSFFETQNTMSEDFGAAAQKVLKDSVKIYLDYAIIRAQIQRYYEIVRDLEATSTNVAAFRYISSPNFLALLERLWALLKRENNALPWETVADLFEGTGIEYAPAAGGDAEVDKDWWRDVYSIAPTAGADANAELDLEGNKDKQKLNEEHFFKTEKREEYNSGDDRILRTEANHEAVLRIDPEQLANRLDRFEGASRQSKKERLFAAIRNASNERGTIASLLNSKRLFELIQSEFPEILNSELSGEHAGIRELILLFVDRALDNNFNLSSGMKTSLIAALVTLFENASSVGNSTRLVFEQERSRAAELLLSPEAGEVLDLLIRHPEIAERELVSNKEERKALASLRDFLSELAALIEGDRLRFEPLMEWLETLEFDRLFALGRNPIEKGKTPAAIRFSNIKRAIENPVDETFGITEYDFKLDDDSPGNSFDLSDLITQLKRLSWNRPATRELLGSMFNRELFELMTGATSPERWNSDKIKNALRLLTDEQLSVWRRAKEERNAVDADRIDILGALTASIKDYLENQLWDRASEKASEIAPILKQVKTKIDAAGTSDTEKARWTEPFSWTGIDFWSEDTPAGKNNPFDDDFTGLAAANKSTITQDQLHRIIALDSDVPAAALLAEQSDRENLKEQLLELAPTLAEIVAYAELLTVSVNTGLNPDSAEALRRNAIKAKKAALMNILTSNYSTVGALHRRVAALADSNLTDEERSRALDLAVAALSPADITAIRSWSADSIADSSVEEETSQNKLAAAWSEFKAVIVTYTRSVFEDTDFLEQINRIAGGEGFALLLDNNGIPATVDASEDAAHTKRRELLELLTALGIDVFAPATIDIYGAEIIDNDQFVFEEDERDDPNKIWIDSLKFAPNLYSASTDFTTTLKTKIDAAEEELWTKAEAVFNDDEIKKQTKQIAGGDAGADAAVTDSARGLFADVGLQSDWFSDTDGSLNDVDTDGENTHGRGTNDNIQSLNHAQLLRIVNPAFATAMKSQTEFAEAPPISSSWTSALRAVSQTGLEQALERIRLFREIGLRDDRFSNLYSHIAGGDENAVPTPEVWDAFVDYLETQNIESLSGVTLTASDLESFKNLLMAEQIKTKLNEDFAALLAEMNKPVNIKELSTIASVFNGDETELLPASDTELLRAHLEMSDSDELVAKTGVDAPNFEQKARIVAALGKLLYDRAEEVATGNINNFSELVADTDWKKLVEILRPLFDPNSSFMLDENLPESLAALRDFGRDWDGFREFNESDGELVASTTPNRKLRLAAQTGLTEITARNYLLDAIALVSRALLDFISSPDATLASTLGLLDATESAVVTDDSAGKLFAAVIEKLKALEKLAQQSDLYAGIYHDRVIGDEVATLKAALDALATKVKTDLDADNETEAELTVDQKKSFYDVLRVDAPLSTFTENDAQTAHETARNTLENTLFAALENTNLETLLDLLILLETAGSSLLAEDVTALSFLASVVPLFNEASSRTALENLVLFGDLSRLRDEVARLDYSALALRSSAVLNALKTTVVAVDAAEKFAFELGTTLRDRIAFLVLRSLVLIAGEVRAAGSLALEHRSLLWLASNADILDTLKKLGSFHFRDRNRDGREDRIAALSAEDRMVTAQLRNERSAVQLVALDSRETLAESIDRGFKESIFSAFDPEIGWSELYSLWQQKTGPERLAIARDLGISLASMRIFNEWSKKQTRADLDREVDSFRPPASNPSLMEDIENASKKRARSELDSSLFDLESSLGRTLGIREMNALALKIKALLAGMSAEEKAELQKKLDLRRFGFTIDTLEEMVSTKEKRNLWADWQLANGAELQTIFDRESILDLLANEEVQNDESSLTNSVLNRAGSALRDDSLLKGLLGEEKLNNTSGVERIEANAVADRIFAFNALERSQKLLSVLRFLESIAVAGSLGMDLQNIVSDTDTNAALLNGNFDFGITEDDFIFDPTTGDVVGLANPADFFSRFPEREWTAGLKALLAKNKTEIDALTKKIAKNYRGIVADRKPASSRLIDLAKSMGIEASIPVLPPAASDNLAFSHGLVLPDRIDTDRILRFAVDDRIAVLAMNILVRIDQQMPRENFDPSLRELSSVQIVRQTPIAPLSRISRTPAYAALFRSVVSSSESENRENEANS